MPHATWAANPAGEYWIDVLLGGRPFEVLVDSGFIALAGFSIAAADYDAIKKAGGFSDIQFNPRMTADGRISFAECGSLNAQLFDPHTQTAIGPVTHVYVYRGAPAVPDRVGLAFFHQLMGCKVLWDLDQRTWRIDYP